MATPEEISFQFPEQGSGRPELLHVNQPPDAGGIFMREKGFTPVYHAHGVVEVAGNEVPYTVSASEAINPTSDIDGAVFIPGFGGYKSSSRRPADALAEAWCPTIRYNPIRNDKDEPSNNTLNPQATHIATVRAVVDHARQNKQIHNLPNGEKIKFEHLALIPHSMGGLTAAPFAEQYSSEVGYVGFLAAVGFGNPRLAHLAEDLPKGIVKAAKDELAPFLASQGLGELVKHARRVFHYYGSNPIRTGGEAYSCLTTNERTTVSQLGALSVLTSYIAFENDILIRPDDSIKEVVDHYTVMDQLGHLAPQVHPRQIARQVLGCYFMAQASKTPLLKIA